MPFFIILFTMIKNLFSTSKTAASVPARDVPEHIARQKKYGPPFYCGTAFCGHHTMSGATECWTAKVEALARINAEAEALRQAGKPDEAFRLSQVESSRYYPEQSPNNWPINRSSSEMRHEYVEKAKLEGGLS